MNFMCRFNIFLNRLISQRARTNRFRSCDRHRNGRGPPTLCKKEFSLEPTWKNQEQKNWLKLKLYTCPWVNSYQIMIVIDENKFWSVIACPLKKMWNYVLKLSPLTLSTKARNSLYNKRYQRYIKNLRIKTYFTKFRSNYTPHEQQQRVDRSSLCEVHPLLTHKYAYIQIQTLIAVVIQFLPDHVHQFAQLLTELGPHSGLKASHACRCRVLLRLRRRRGRRLLALDLRLLDCTHPPHYHAQ